MGRSRRCHFTSISHNNAITLAANAITPSTKTGCSHHPIFEVLMGKYRVKIVTQNEIFIIIQSF
ncbi:MAG TPA: hypothetical protein PKD90_06165 [Phnomibacter sp.]|nr:hypothetical protein [Phnomibacter sp.]